MINKLKTTGYWLIDALQKRSGDVDSRLLAAAMAGDRDQCQRLLDRGASLEARNALGWTPLIQAVRYHHPGLCNFLLQAGADINASDGEKGWSALMHAIRVGDDAIFHLLMNHGANQNARELLQWTPLMIAIHYNRIPMCLTLIKRGAEVDSQDAFGQSPLMLAAKAGRQEICQMLVDAGAKIDLPDHHGHSPLQRAAAGGHESCCEILLAAGASDQIAGGLFSIKSFRDEAFVHLVDATIVAREVQSGTNTGHSLPRKRSGL